MTIICSWANNRHGTQLSKIFRHTFREVNSAFYPSWGGKICMGLGPSDNNKRQRWV